MNDNQAASRGAVAEREWTELESAFEQVRDAILKELVQTPPTQDQKVLKLHMAVQNLEGVRQALRNVIDNGVMARQALAAARLTQN